MSAAIREYPMNLEVEQALVGSLIVDPTAFDDLPSGITVDWFFRHSHQVIFRAILTLRAQGNPVGLLSVENELKRINQISDVGGFEGLCELADRSPNSANTAYFAEIVRSHAVRRDTIRIATELIAAQFQCDEEAEPPIERAMASLLDLTAKGSSESVLSMPEVMSDWRLAVERRRKGETDGLPTGLRELDAITGGFAPGRMYVLAARPAMGKTALALQMATALCKAGSRGLFVSQEMGHIELGERMVSREADMNGYKLRDAWDMTDEQWQHAMEAAGRLATLHLSIDDTPGRTASQIASTARRLKARGGLDFIAVDYVQLLESEPGAKSNRQEQVAKISRILKQTIARGLNIPVLVLSQLNRGVESREDKTPRMADLRESGAIEQDADQVWLLHRPSYYDPNDQPGLAKLIIAKNRQGQSSIVTLHFHGNTTSFSELDRGHDY